MGQGLQGTLVPQGLPQAWKLKKASISIPNTVLSFPNSSCHISAQQRPRHFKLITTHRLTGRIPPTPCISLCPQRLLQSQGNWNTGSGSCPFRCCDQPAEPAPLCTVATSVTMGVEAAEGAKSLWLAPHRGILSTATLHPTQQAPLGQQLNSPCS